MRESSECLKKSSFSAVRLCFVAMRAGHFLLTKGWAKSCGEQVHFWTHSGRLLGYEHPQLNYYHLHGIEFADGGNVICYVAKRIVDYLELELGIV